MVRALSVAMGTALVIREDEEYAELHSTTFPTRALSPREAVVRLAVHCPAIFGAFRRPDYQAPEAA